MKRKLLNDCQSINDLTIKKLNIVFGFPLIIGFIKINIEVQNYS